MSCPICRAQREAAARGKHKTIADVLRDAAELERFHDDAARRAREGLVQLDDGREVRPMRGESEEVPYTEEPVRGALFVGAITDDMVRRLRESLWSTWGAGRQTTDWPTDDQLRAALDAALHDQPPTADGPRTQRRDEDA